MCANEHCRDENDEDRCELHVCGLVCYGETRSGFYNTPDVYSWICDALRMQQWHVGYSVSEETAQRSEILHTAHLLNPHNGLDAVP